MSNEIILTENKCYGSYWENIPCQILIEISMRFSQESHKIIMRSQSYFKRKLNEISSFQREKIRMARQVRIIRTVRINPII